MPHHPRLALVDCNNFYVSCERLFRPDLWHRPVMVLSNNDGCVVSRSAEVKALGIKMGVPLFQVQDLVDQYAIQLFSSNYTLYADLSSRVMATLESFTPSMEIYSIDEAFLDLSGIYPCYRDPEAYGQKIRQTVARHTGIPVCVGMGPTKTLAKLANYAAKKWPQTGGVVDLSDPKRQQKLLQQVPVNDIWGIGRQTAARLKPLGIETAWDLARQPPKRLQQAINILVARTAMELNGIACLSLETAPPAKQQIVCSRSFSHKLFTLEALRQAVATFACRAAEKLRRQHSEAACVTVFIRTNPFASNEPQYHRAASVTLATATQDSRQLLKAAETALNSLYQPGYGYQKCGVQLSALHAQQAPTQSDLFALEQTARIALSDELMQTLDRINARYPKAITIAATGLQQTWQPKTQHLSPRYTTDWRELGVVKG